MSMEIIAGKAMLKMSGPMRMVPIFCCDCKKIPLSEI